MSNGVHHLPCSHGNPHQESGHISCQRYWTKHLLPQRPPVNQAFLVRKTSPCPATELGKWRGFRAIAGDFLRCHNFLRRHRGDDRRDDRGTVCHRHRIRALHRPFNRAEPAFARCRKSGSNLPGGEWFPSVHAKAPNQNFHLNAIITASQCQLHKSGCGKAGPPLTWRVRHALQNLDSQGGAAHPKRRGKLV